MKGTVLGFGLLSGFILAALTGIMVPLCMNGTLSYENSELLGYTMMLLAFIAVFFGVRSYRQNVAGGSLTFGRAFQVGILITLVTCAVYVIGWEIVYHTMVPDFADKYAAKMIEKVKASGAPAARVAEEEAKMADFKRLYANPFINVGMTFLEVFPVGLVVTLVSAAILRRKAAPPPRDAAAVA